MITQPAVDTRANNMEEREIRQQNDREKQREIVSDRQTETERDMYNVERQWEGRTTAKESERV